MAVAVKPGIYKASQQQCLSLLPYMRCSMQHLNSTAELQHCCESTEVIP